MWKRVLSTTFRRGLRRAREDLEVGWGKLLFPFGVAHLDAPANIVGRQRPRAVISVVLRTCPGLVQDLSRTCPGLVSRLLGLSVGNL